MSDDKLIAEARQEESIHDKLGDGFSEGSEERAFYYAHRDRYKRLADALEAATEGDYHEGLEEGIKIGRAERDAALAAIERVRAILSVKWRDGGVPSRWHSQLTTALDGAPEPE